MADYVRVTLETPFKGGGYRMRVGSNPAVRNPSWDANNPQAGPQFIPGGPAFYPTDGSFLIADDPARNSVQVPAWVAKVEFGDWEAPAVEARGQIAKHTRGNERERLIHRWNLYRRPKSNGSFNPDLKPLGLNPYPHVAIRPLSARGFPEKDEQGNEIVIRPFKFFGFEDEHFEAEPIEVAEMEDLRAIVLRQQRQLEQLMAGNKREKVS